jgi:hypothetical protein
MQQPIKTLFKQIQDYVGFSETGGMTIGAAQQVGVAYTNVFSTGSFLITCHHWNYKEEVKNTWNNFKTHFSAPYCQHKQMQGESASTYRYHSANADLAQTEDEMDEATIGDLANLDTAREADHGVQAITIAEFINTMAYGN